MPRVQALAVALALSLAAPARALQIYGTDDRRDVKDLDKAAAALAASTAAVFKSSSVVARADGSFDLATTPHGEARQLVAGSAFYDQPAGAYCSSALVGPDLVLTAGHCVETAAQCADARFVFGFALDRAGADPRRAAAANVFRCARVVAMELDDRGADWALVRLDRPAAGRSPLAVDFSRRPEPGDALSAIGYPAGLPAKHVTGRARSIHAAQGFLVASLDTFPGSSGSAVFSEAGKIVGVLMRSDPLFHYRAVVGVVVTAGAEAVADQTLFMPNVYAEDGGSGSAVTLAKAFQAALRTALAAPTDGKPRGDAALGELLDAAGR